jgi:hypothetical protein
VSQLATAAELASWLQQDVDTSTANLVLTAASARFELESGTKFSSTAATYQVEGRGQPVISLPRGPVIAVSAVRVAGVTLAASDYTLVISNLYRVIGWGRIWGSTVPTAPYVGFPPELVEVDYTYGYTTVPDDVKGVVLETAGVAYQSPNPGNIYEGIDDYIVKSAPDAGGIQLSPAAQLLAEYYRSGGFA